MKNAINWFEIPVRDFDRAKKFYEKILNYTMNTQDFGGDKLGFLPSEKGALGGAICCGDSCKPSTEGVLIYINGDPDLSGILNRVEGAGGKIIMEKRQISPEIGYMAIFTDSEGNRIALHSDK
jgi:predicted enzyme related to lactoylglutathione lyase